MNNSSIPSDPRELYIIARRRIAAGNTRNFISFIVDSSGSQASHRLPSYITENPGIHV